MEILSNLLNNKVKELKACRTKINELEAELAGIQSDVFNARSNNPEITKEELADAFSGFQTTYHKLNLLGQHGGKLIEQFKTIDEIAGLTKTKVEIKDQEEYDKIKKSVESEPTIFVVENNTLVFADKVFEKNLLEIIDKQVRQPEELERLYNSPAMTPPNK